MPLKLDPAPGWPAPGQPGIVWLGQAGFWIETGAHRILVDPYLSDSLARKYAGQVNGHRRLLPPPVLTDALPRPDLVLVTHAHTDHMDPDTLAPLAARFPDLPFVVPVGRESTARERIGTYARLVPVDAGEVLTPLDGLRLTVLPAAHETLDRDARGRHLFLGYAIATDHLCLYHSGDCIPYDGLTARLRTLAPDIALLPVNGRDEMRLAAGIPGNFTLAEAIAITRDAGIPFLIPHHFGMFAFNTCDESQIDAAAASSTAPKVLRPAIGQMLRIGQTEATDGPHTDGGGRR